MERYIPNTHILWAEYRCHHCGEIPPDFYIAPKIINLKYMRLFQAHSRIREKCGRPVGVSRGYSCTNHQLYIFLNKVVEKYGRTLSSEMILRIINDPTMTPFSVHPFGLALDLIPWGIDPEKEWKRYQEELERIRRAAQEIESELRIGRSYERHVHIDRGFEIDPRYSVSLREGARW